MKEIKGFNFAEPDGAFYAFPCVDYYFGKSDGEIPLTMLMIFACIC